MKKFALIIAIGMMSCGSKKTPAQIDADNICHLRHELFKRGDIDDLDSAGKTEYFKKQNDLGDKMYEYYEKYQNDKEEMQNFKASLHECPE